jgi:hypothetical protein
MFIKNTKQKHRLADVRPNIDMLLRKEDYDTQAPSRERQKNPMH